MKAVRKYLWFVPTIIWMVVIFQFSGQEGEASGGLSLKVTEEVAQFLHSTVLPGHSTDELVEILHPGVRKAAHMTEYAILYILLFLSFFFSMLATRSAAVSILISFVYACTDEIHQTFVPGRSGSFLDVCVDMTGVLAAVMLVLFIYSSWQSRHLKERGYEKEKMEKEL